jgi:hypothetical protein
MPVWSEDNRKLIKVSAQGINDLVAICWGNNVEDLLRWKRLRRLPHWNVAFEEWVLLKKSVGAEESVVVYSTPLKIAVAYDAFAIVVEILKDAATDLMYENQRDDVVQWAAKLPRVADQLTIFNLNVLPVVVNQYNPLVDAMFQRAVEDNDLEMVKQIWKMQMSLMVDKKMAPMYYLAGHNKAAMIRGLCADPLFSAHANVVSDCGSPLQGAARDGAVEAARVLLEHKCRVDNKRKDGETPLHGAAKHNHVEVACVLLAAKAVMDAQDKKRQTPIELAKRYDQTAVVRLLLAAKASLDAGPSKRKVLQDVAKGAGVDPAGLLGQQATHMVKAGVTAKHKKSKRSKKVAAKLDVSLPVSR